MLSHFHLTKCFCMSRRHCTRDGGERKKNAERIGTRKGMRGEHSLVFFTSISKAFIALWLLLLLLLFVINWLVLLSLIPSARLRACISSSRRSSFFLSLSPSLRWIIMQISWYRGLCIYSFSFPCAAPSVFKYALSCGLLCAAFSYYLTRLYVAVYNGAARSWKMYGAKVVFLW